MNFHPLWLTIHSSFDYFRYFVYSKKERKKTGEVNQTCENTNSTYSPRSQFFRRVFIPESSNGAVARAAPSPHSKHAYQQYLPYVSGRLTAIRKNRGLKRGTARNTIPSRAIPPLRNPRLARPPSLPLLLPRPTIRHNQLRFYFHPANRAKKKRKNPKDSFRSLQARKLAQRDHRSLLSSPSCQPFSSPPPSLTIPDWRSQRVPRKGTSSPPIYVVFSARRTSRQPFAASKNSNPRSELIPLNSREKGG